MASRAPLRLNHRCPVWFHSCRLRVEGKAFRPPFSCAKKPEADDKTVTIPLRAHEIWLPSEVRSRPLRLIPPSPPANLPPCIPHELRTTQGRRSPACPPPAGDAAPKSSPFRCRHRPSVPSGIGRRARFVRSVCADRPHLGKTTPQARLLLRSVCTIFTEDRRHLSLIHI